MYYLHIANKMSNQISSLCLQVGHIHILYVFISLAQEPEPSSELQIFWSQAFLFQIFFKIVS